MRSEDDPIIFNRPLRGLLANRTPTVGTAPLATSAMALATARTRLSTAHI